MSGSKQIKGGAVLSYLSIIINIVSGLIYTPWMIGTIGKSQYGLYTLANSLITLFLVDFGLSSATARFLSKYRAEGDREGAERFLGAVYKLYILVDAVILVALTVIFLLIDKIYVNLTPNELEAFKVVYVISALFSVINFPLVTFNGILISHEKFIPLKSIDIAYRVFNVVFTVIALLFGGGLYALVMVHVLVGLFVLLLKFIVIKRTIPIKVNFKKTDRSIYKSIFGFSIWVTVASLAQRLVFNITPSILGIVASSAAIAVFGVVSTIEGYTYIVSTAINGMFMPKISRIVIKEDSRENLSKLLLSVGRYQYAINGLIVAGFAAVGRQFINLWMGPDYISAYYGILWVIAPGLIYNTLQIANTTLVVENKVKLQAVISIITGVVNVILSFPLSKMFGEIGACISICIAYTLRGIIMNVISHTVLKLDILRLAKECYLKMSVPIFLSIGVGIALNSLFNQETWLSLIIKVVIIIISYLITAYFVGLNNNERKKVREFVKAKILKTKKEQN